jgi:hypothetical protein
LTDVEQRTLRLAMNRLSEKGEWDLAELKIEFEELILTGAPIEISGFSLDEVDQIILNLDQVPKAWCRWLLAQVECILCLGPETINGQTWLLAANPLYNATHGAQVQFLP